MKVARVAGIALALVCAGAARNKDSNKPAEIRGENESVVINATVYAKPEAVKELIGSDLGGHYIVVAVEVTPRFGKQVAIDRDDFVLKTDKDGERTGPFAPSQIAGKGAMVVRQTGGSGATPMHDNDGPIWGGYPGSMGQPRRLGGDGVGSAGAPDGAEAKTRTASHEKEDPMLEVLKEKELPQTQVRKKGPRPATNLQKYHILATQAGLPHDVVVCTNFRRPKIRCRIAFEG